MPRRDPSTGEPTPDRTQNHSDPPARPSPSRFGPWVALFACLGVSIALSPWAVHWGLPAFPPQTAAIVVGLVAGLTAFAFRSSRAAAAASVQATRELHDARQRLASSEALVSELRQVESSLRRTEEQFRRAFEDANVGMAIADCDLRLRRVNGAFCQMLGFAPEELVNRNVCDLTHADDREVTLQRIETLMRKAHDRVSIEKRYLHRDGRVVWGLANVAVVRDEKDNPQFLVAHVQDISETKKAASALADSKERLRAIVETIEEVFWIAEPGKVHASYISPGVQKIWGHPPERFMQNPELVLETIHPEDRTTFLRAVDHQADGHHTSIEYRVFHADRSVRWVWDQGFPVRNSDGKLVAVNGLATNITERKRLEAQLRQAQKMEAIGTLAGGIAHDFNNILGSIIGFTELARLDAAGNDAVVQNLNDVLKASHRAKGLVQQILAFSRQQESHCQPVQFGPIVREAARLLRAGAPASIRLSVQIADVLPTVLADPTQLHQLVMNLGTNAIQAVGPGNGAVSLRLEPFAADEAFTSAHPGVNPGPHVRLTVTDTGTGMNAETMDHMFDPFFTTKSPGEGSGLGLSVVHGIVKNHQGIITVQSQPGTGTTFHIVLPAGAHENPPPASIDRVVAAAETGRGQHILFVDDEPTLGLVGRRVLERCGFRVTVKTDPAQALEAFGQNPADFALVITDLTMPSMDGLTLAAKLQRLRPEVPILLTTGHGASITLEAARQAGIRDLLFKPNDLESIGEAVCRALEIKSNGPRP